jgi:peroxiredoxin family protein
MSEDRLENKPVATLHKAELEITWVDYGYFKNSKDVEYLLEIKQENMSCIIKDQPGIYRLKPNNHREKDNPGLYVGEAQSLAKRLNDYKNAGYYPGAKKEYTNRRIQGWMHNLNKLKDEGVVKISVCTEAYILYGDEKKQKLDLNSKHNRILIENLEISISAKDFRIQNFRCNWKSNEETCVN